MRHGGTASKTRNSHCARWAGCTVSGLPNLFLFTGPQGPSVLYNVPLAIEDQVDFIPEAITDMRARGLVVMTDALEISSQTKLATVRKRVDGKNVILIPRRRMASERRFCEPPV